MNEKWIHSAGRKTSSAAHNGENVEVRFANAEEVDHWDSLILQSPDEGTVYRSQANIDGMILQGFMPVYLIVNGMAVTTFRVDVPIFGAMWVLFGPPVVDAEGLIKTVPALSEFASKHGISAVRVRPQIRANETDRKVIADSGLKRVPAWLDDHTVIIDLTGSEDDVFARFKKRARKAIRRSRREGVTVTLADTTDDNCRMMFEMLDATSGGRFAIPDREVSISLFKRFNSSNNGQLFFALHQGQIVAAAFVATFGLNALYLGAGSARKNPGDSSECGLGNSGAAYSMQWEIMKWARTQGCTRYDLDGTPSSRHAQNSLHPRRGVGQFKTAFSDEIIDYLGAYQISVDPIRAWSIRQMEILGGHLSTSWIINRLLRRQALPNPDYVWLHEGLMPPNTGTVIRGIARRVSDFIRTR